MKTSHQVALLVAVTLAVGLGSAHFVAKDGLPGLWRKMFPPSPPAPPRAAPETPVAQPRTAASGRSPQDELRDAERAYDDGDFGRATDLFLVARADVPGNVRDRAARGLTKAVLAWALTANAAAPSPLPADPEAEIARLQADAETRGTEQRWYETAMFAAGAGFQRKLKYLAQQAISCARAGGPVERRLKAVLERTSARAPALREAMVAQGFLQPTDPLAAATAAGPPAGPKLQWRPSPVPPIGRFKPETKARLARAVQLEQKGSDEYAQSGPDQKDRRQHLRAAYDALVEARNIYQDAAEEDSVSRELSERLRSVMEMISHVNKERTLGD